MVSAIFFIRKNSENLKVFNRNLVIASRDKLEARRMAFSFVKRAQDSSFRCK